jgi:hypothetical protein
VFGTVGGQLDKAADKGTISQAGKAILGAITEAWNKLADAIHDKIKEQNKKKEK